MQKRIILILTIVLGAVYTLANANVILNFSDLNMQTFQNKFSLVHFMAPGNNFWGSILRLPSKSISWTTITFSSGNSDSKTWCTKLLRGLYYNSQRGKRLRPLDSESLELLKQQNHMYDNLTIEWWLYTTCENTSPYSIFGYIKYNRKGVVSHIVAGTKYNYHDNKIIAKFAKSFQYFDNKVPIWYIYDSNGGIGYVGGNLSGHEDLIEYLSGWWSINSWFQYSWDTIVSSHQTQRTTTIQSGNTAMETMRNMIVQWSVGVSKSMDTKERLSLLGNEWNKTVIYNGSDINSSTLINFAKQKAQKLCQGQTRYTTDFTLTTAAQENIVCIQGSNVTINLTDYNSYKDKTIIVKNGNVILEGGMQDNSPSLDLFIDKWLIYLTDSINSATFDDQWFPKTPWTNAWLYLKWNFIINGLLVWWIPWAETGFNHKLHLQGKLTTLNTPLVPSEERIDQIEELLGNNYENFINLQNVFVRTCGLNGISSDTTQCNSSSTISTTPIVILNGNYQSNILQ